jgi:Holliday junction resolvase
MRSQWLLALACIASLALGAWLALKLRDLLDRMRGRALQRQGARGERDAERVLRAHGYAIRERQARRSYAMQVDGARRTAEVNFDFIVERGGETLVAEVKTGSGAPRIERAETRRQLLEYQLATGARCVLLVDPGAGTISEVAFPITMPAPAPQGSWRLSAVLVTMVLVAAWYLQSAR